MIFFPHFFLFLLFLNFLKRWRKKSSYSSHSHPLPSPSSPACSASFSASFSHFNLNKQMKNSISYKCNLLHKTQTRGVKEPYTTSHYVRSESHLRSNRLASASRTRSGSFLVAAQPSLNPHGMACGSYVQLAVSLLHCTQSFSRLVLALGRYNNMTADKCIMNYSRDCKFRIEMGKWINTLNVYAAIEYINRIHNKLCFIFPFNKFYYNSI